VTISRTSRVVAAKRQVSSEIGGEVVILDLEAGVYFGLNEVGARIWSLLKDPVGVEDVCMVIVEDYDVTADRCREAVLALFQDLADRGLIEVVG
jgi:hypothetical protein